MKRFVLVVVLAWSGAVLAQEPSTSAAKQAFSTLGKSLEKLKELDPAKNANAFKAELDKAQRKIEAIRKAEPGFDLSAQEKALQELEAVLAQSKVDKAAARDAQQQERAAQLAAAEAKRAEEEEAQRARDAARAELGRVENEVEAIFRAPLQDAYHADPGKPPEVVFKAIADRYAAVDTAATARRIVQAREALRYTEPKTLFYERQGYDDRLAKLLKSFDSATTEDGAATILYTLREYELFWNTLEKVLPDDAVARANAATTRKAVAGLPSLEALKAQARANRKAVVDRVRLPVAVRQDAATEALVRQAFEAEGWHEVVLKVNLVDRDWQIEKHPQTGALLFRYQSAGIKAKNKAGECVAYQMTVKQEWTGSGYSATTRRHSHLAQPMSCEN